MANFTRRALAIPDVILVEPRKFSDPRGFFMETYSAPAFREFGIDCTFVQDNQSLSTRRGTLRGLHFQTPPHAQAKLVRVLRGSIFDVAVDLRVGSPSYGQWCAATLTASGGEELFVPRGFAHGFCTLEANVEVAYKVDDIYVPDCDSGLVWQDATLAIDWPIAADEIIVSDKDGKLPAFTGFSSPFSAFSQATS
ncbi:MAG TPA: dTDP-4-dehydrorhamnose 3,5-epimerase [Beijerinckiaceae bacterium]|jgi:dTDP-4-dehydrorhamnose 3,5-epimerase|nr:dTDP-4-dehydrorhamnose 3,5-epimerase [Beijerinckiaceae bacterium]